MLLLSVVIVLWFALVPINLTLYVGNQSSAIDPVDIQVEIDGRLVVNDLFPFGNGHTCKKLVLPVRPGWHRINARSVKGEAVFHTEFSTFWSRWAVLDYTYFRDKPDASWAINYRTPQQFLFIIWSKPVKSD
jgi:hypothetical protein